MKTINPLNLRNNLAPLCLLGRFLFAAVLALAITGCASGPRFSAMHSSEAPIPPGDGRVYIYRPSAFGAAVQPHVMLNGEAVCRAVPHGYIYVDRPAGDYEFVTTTEVKRTLNVTLEAGQVRYVRLNIGMGFGVGHVWSELMDNAVGEKQIRKCHYMHGNE